MTEFKKSQIGGKLETKQKQRMQKKNKLGQQWTLKIHTDDVLVKKNLKKHEHWSFVTVENPFQIFVAQKEKISIIHFKFEMEARCERIFTTPQTILRDTGHRIYRNFKKPTFESLKKRKKKQSDPHTYMIYLALA